MESSPALSPASLSAAIEALLLGSPMSRSRRLLGVEYERLVLHRETRESAPLQFCCDLFAQLVEDLGATPGYDGGVLNKMAGGDFGMSMEPGGQLEVATAPRRSMQELDAILRHVTAAIDARLASTPYELVCLGHAPVTKVDSIEILPRPRYLLMNERMPERGALSRNMMRATAGFQLAYDVTSRDDAGRKLALLYRLSPILVALTANSRQIEGKDSGYESFRHIVWWDTDRDRSGVPDGCLHAETALSGYAAYAKRATTLFLRRDGEIVPAPDKPFEALVAEGLVNLEDLDLHLSSLFPFIRLRNYLEVRCFDCVEWPLARSILALLSGVLYCGAATAQAESFSAVLVREDSAALRALHVDAARNALDGRVGEKTFRELALELTAIAAGRLGDVDCNWATPGDLDALRAHLKS